MKGCIVEIHGTSATHLNGKRGIVQEKKDGRVIINITGYKTVSVKPKNLCQVFCLGLSSETHVRVKSATLDESCVRNALRRIDSRKYYLLSAGERDGWQHFLQVRAPFFKMAADRINDMKREFLLRVYVAKYSQDDPGAKILFTDSMANENSDIPFVDLKTDRLLFLSTRNFDDEGLDTLNVEEVILDSIPVESLQQE